MNKLTAPFFLKTIFISAALFIFQSAVGWGVTGHRTSAEIAQQHLSKKTKKELRK